MTFKIKRNDTSPAIQGTLKDSNDNAISIVGATVRFHMLKRDGTVIVDEAASIVNDTGGIVKYDWVVADTDEAGFFDAEFEVTYADTSVETFPNNEYIKIHIYEDLA